MKLLNKIKGIAKAFWGQCKRFYAFSNRHPWLQCVILGLVLNLFIESMSRHSLINSLVHAVTSPLVFLFNALIITFVLSLCTFFKSRNVLYLLASAVFIGFGIANGVLLTMRITPLEWADLQVVKLSIIRIYLSNFMIALIVLVIIAAIVGLVILFIKAPKLKKVNYLKNSIATVIIGVTLFGSLFIFRATGILLSEHVKNLANAYKDYGFNYCFLSSMLDLGIDKPSVYDESDVKQLVNEINSSAENNQEIKSNNYSDHNGNHPNIIILQLETFFDVQHLANISFSENPIPVFSTLQKKYTTGYLSVPSIGAGTANTEFEVISGMSLEYFGVGEYPYKTILQTEACESICYNLDQYGYTSHAIHNNDATFYDRNVVFSNLGFNTFTSLEFMTDVEFTTAGWAKDEVLVGSITDALDSTKGSDLVYTISVQSHGKYPSDYTEIMPITVTGIEDEDTKREFEYYINQLHEVDKFVGDLLTDLTSRDEKTVVILFGDHLPSFDISEEDLTNNNLFQTEYVIWDNFGLSKDDKDLMTYQLGADIMGKLGLDNGIMTKLHQNYANTDKYKTYLELFEYDMLYGEGFTWGGKENNPYKTTQLQMGIKEIGITDVISTETKGTLNVTGKNFTPYSVVFINDDEYDTVYVDSKNLVVTDAYPVPGDYISIIQVNEEGDHLRQSKNYLVGGTVSKPTVSAVSTHVIYKSTGLSTETVIAIITASVALATVMLYLSLRIVRKKKSDTADQ